MKGNLKRVFQAMFMVLATVMLLSIPASAASSKTVATIGKKSYTSLEAAVKKVKKGQTIKLKKDVKVSSLTLNRNVKYTINLNGHKITRKNSKKAANLYVKKGTVTIKNGTLGCKVTVYKNASLTTSSVKMQSKYKPGITVNKKGKLTIKSGTYYKITNKGTTSIKKGTVKSTVSNNGGKITLSGGTYTSLAFNYSGTMAIKGGTYKYSLSNSGALISNWGTMTISGGSFTNTDTSCNESSAVVINNGTLTFSGGTITNNNKTKPKDGRVVCAVQNNSGTFKMTGGTLRCSNSKGYALFNTAKASITGGSLSSGQVYKVYTETTGSFSYSSKVLSASTIHEYDPSDPSTWN